MRRKPLIGFAAVLVIGLIAAAVPVIGTIMDALAEDRAVAALEKIAGEVRRTDTKLNLPSSLAWLWPFKSTTVSQVTLAGPKVNDAVLKNLVDFQQLTNLTLNGTQITDAGLKDLVALKRLETLQIQGSQITDAGLKELAALKQLKNILFIIDPMTDAEVKRLTNALPGCMIRTVGPR